MTAVQSLMISKPQLRALYASAKQHGMSNDDLHARVHAETGKEHISDLTWKECARLLNQLNGNASRPEPPMDRISHEQVAVIFGLAKRLGWKGAAGGVDKKRLVAFISKRFGVDKIDWLTPALGTKVTEALKAMAAGGRGERKQAGGDPHG